MKLSKNPGKKPKLIQEVEGSRTLVGNGEPFGEWHEWTDRVVWQHGIEYFLRRDTGNNWIKAWRIVDGGDKLHVAEKPKFAMEIIKKLYPELVVQ